jgi:urea transporter
VVTVFVQAAMNAWMLPYSIATLTAPFCITTWLFLLPNIKLNR